MSQERAFLKSGRNTIIHKDKKLDLVVVNSDIHPRIKVTQNGLEPFKEELPKNRRDAKDRYLEMVYISSAEVFGEENFIGCFIWNKKNVVQNDAKHLSINHEYILVFGKSYDDVTFNLLPRNEEQLARYKNPDNDPRGKWTSVALQAKSGSGTYEITFENGVSWQPVKGTYPRLSKNSLLKAYEEGRLWFGKNGSNVPRLKKYLSEVKDGVISSSLLLNSDVG